MFVSVKGGKVKKDFALQKTIETLNPLKPCEKANNASMSNLTI